AKRLPPGIGGDMLVKTACAVLLAASVFGASSIPVTTGVVAHEWGTFTSVAALDGNPVRWFALGGPSKLPCFVHGPGATSPKINGYSIVRMETPVVYFYSPRKSTISVKVDFPQGVVTEWYPDAAVGPLNHIEWTGVEVLPGQNLQFPSGQAGNHYYA